MNNYKSLTGRTKSALDFYRMDEKNKNLVVIFGRTNVGKSTLFNCLIEKKQALVSPVAGTTRDSNIGQAVWRGRNITLVDTGGIMDVNLMIESKRQSRINKTDIDIKVQRQARDYIKKAAVVLFLVDAQEGLLPADRAMAQNLKKIKPDLKKIILVANKADSQKWRQETAEFNKLSLGEPFAVSAVTGAGTGDLLDAIFDILPRQTKEPALPQTSRSDKPDIIKIAIIGKPNVGKSSLLNAITGEERVIVSPIPHTTREPQDTILEYKTRTFKILDTAGISRQGQKDVRSSKLRESLERRSIVSSLQTLRPSDIAFLVIDINEGLTHQEAKLVEEVLAKKVSLVIVANKWDLVEEPDEKKYTDLIYRRLPFVTWAPIQFVSAKSGKKVNKILDLAIRIAAARKITISKNALERFLGTIVKKQRPLKRSGQNSPYIRELRQESSGPPVFAIRVGTKENIAYAYIKFIENRLREKFDFFGTPITVYVERNRKVHGKHE